MGNVLSDSVGVQKGTSQGSVLSCTCFMLAINDIVSTLSENVKSTLYVDDFTIYTFGMVPHILERKLEVVISRLEKWCHTTVFVFSPSKTVAVHICQKRNCPKMANSLTMNNTNIRCVENYKFLGMKFDSCLTWRNHITLLKASCHKTLNLLKHLSHRTWGADRTSLLRLYIMLLKPKLDYGCEAYSSASRTLPESLNQIQNLLAIRIATGAFWSSPVDSLHMVSGIKPLSTYRERKIINYYMRISTNRNHPMHTDLAIDDCRADENIDHNLT